MSKEGREKNRDIVPDVGAFMIFALAAAGCIFYLSILGGHCQDAYMKLEVAMPVHTRLFLFLSALFRQWWYALIPLVGIAGLIPMFVIRGRAWIIYLVWVSVLGIFALAGRASLALPTAKIDRMLQERGQRPGQKPAARPVESLE